MVISHCGSPEARHFRSASASARPGPSIPGKALHRLPSFPWATAIQPFLTQASTLHGALRVENRRVVYTFSTADNFYFCLNDF